MLSILIGLPLLGAIFLAITPPDKAKLMALTMSGVTLLWTLFLFSQFDLGVSQFQMAVTLSWLPVIGLKYDLGLDGLSLLMVGLNALLTWIAIYSARSDLERPRLFYSLMLLTSSIIAGTFLAKNFLLFF